LLLAGKDVCLTLTANTSIEEFVVKSLKIFVTLALLPPPPPPAS
jgi:hypothetical protein